MATDYFTLEWKAKFEEGLAKEWRFNSLRHAVPHTLSVTDGRATLQITSSKTELLVELLDEPTRHGQVLSASAEVWEALFTDELESLTRLVRQGKITLEGDAVGIMLRWRLVFATVEALALSVRSEI